MRKLLERIEPAFNEHHPHDGLAVVGGGGLPIKLGGLMKDSSSTQAFPFPSSDYADALIHECFKRRNRSAKGGWRILKPIESMQISIGAEDACSDLFVEGRGRKRSYLPSAFSPFFCRWQCRAIDIGKSTKSIVDASNDLEVSVRRVEPSFEEVVELYLGKGGQVGKCRFLSGKGVIKVKLRNLEKARTILVLGRAVVVNTRGQMRLFQRMDFSFQSWGNLSFLALVGVAPCLLPCLLPCLYLI